MRIFVLAQHAVIRAALRQLLSSSADVEIAGESAISGGAKETIRKQHPDVVLMEIVEASDPLVTRTMESVRELGAHLVVLASHGDLRTVRAMMRAGVTGYVLKDSTHSDLLIALRSAALGRKFLDASLINAPPLEDEAPRLSLDYPLSKRETEVLKSIVEGYASGSIARKLGLSVKTIETYRARIYRKLEAHSRADLVKYAITSGLITIQEGLRR